MPSRAANKSDSLSLRVASSLVLAPLALAAIWYGGTPFVVALAAVGGLAGYEWANLMNRDGHGSDLVGPPLVLALIVLIGAFAKLNIALAAALAAGAIVFIVARLRSHGSPILTGTGVSYIALALVAMVTVRLQSAEGLAWSIFLCAVVWATDIGAYTAGKLVGGPKLAPLVSPGKTWAGFTGGVLAALLAGLLAAAAFGHIGFAWATVLAAVLSVVAQAGDLLESLVKRRSGAGDSGRLIPGHGGILDRIDGLMPAGAVLCIVVASTEGI